MLSNLQFKLIFPVSDICLSDITISSGINLIIFSIGNFLSHKNIETYPSIPIIWWNKKKLHYFE